MIVTLYEITSDTRTVWINDSSGCCIGRFSRNGIDVHHAGKVQMETGQECIACKPGPVTPGDWRTFQAAMLKHHGVVVSDHHRPQVERGRK